MFEAIKGGSLGSVARRLPDPYLKRFNDRAALSADVKLKYGDDAQVLWSRKGPYVVAGRMAFWSFFEEDGQYRETGSGRVYTAREYEEICRVLGEGEDHWIEARGFAPAHIMTWVESKGCDSLKEQPDNIAEIFTDFRES